MTSIGSNHRPELFHFLVSSGPIGKCNNEGENQRTKCLTEVRGLNGVLFQSKNGSNRGRVSL